MTACDHPTPTGLRTIEIRVPGADCPWCFNDAMDRIRDLAGVAEVRASIAGECIEVRHHEVPQSLLVETLRTYLHGTDDPSHECQMVAVEPELVTPACGCVQASAEPQARVEARASMETLTEAIRRLRTAGYATDFFASPEGNLVCRSCGHSHDPETIEIRETVRFEGDSNPDDEAILLALSGADGCLGQFKAAFGPPMATADLMAFQRFNQARRQGTAT